MHAGRLEARGRVGHRRLAVDDVAIEIAGRRRVGDQLEPAVAGRPQRQLRRVALEAQPDGSRRRRPQTEADAALGKDGGSEGHLVAARQHAREGLAAGTLRGNGAIATGHLPR